MSQHQDIFTNISYTLQSYIHCLSLEMDFLTQSHKKINVGITKITISIFINVMM